MRLQKQIDDASRRCRELYGVEHDENVAPELFRALDESDLNVVYVIFHINGSVTIKVLYENVEYIIKQVEGTLFVMHSVDGNIHADDVTPETVVNLILGANT
jgi:hypothetical protein